MKLFVTGGTGFVGTHFIQQALFAGHSVRAIYRSDVVTVQHLGDVDWIKSDLHAIESAHLIGYDAVIHFAAAGVSPKQQSFGVLIDHNVIATQMLLEKSHAAGIRRTVVAGSFAEYGISANDYAFIPPDAPLKPTSHYASSKAACFVTSHATAVELELELCYLRIFSAYGAGQSKLNLWPALRDAALAGRDFEMTLGEQVRDYVPVDQVVVSFLHAVTRSDVKGGLPIVSNVGSGKPVSTRTFAETWWKKFNAKGELKIGALPYRNNEVMRYVPLLTSPTGGTN